MNGLTHAGQLLALDAVLPVAAARWIALFTTLPGRDGTGGVEAAGSGYARVSIAAWTDTVAAGRTERANAAVVQFPELTGDLLGVVGWGVFTAGVGGTLTWIGELRDANGVAVVRNFALGNIPTFSAGDLTLEVT